MRRPLLIVCLVALVHAALYIVHERPDWDAVWTDQGGYHRLAAGILETGSFTRYSDSPDYVPEVLRTPGYPAFVAAVYLVFGSGNHMAVAVVQAFVFAALCLLAYAIGTRLRAPRYGGQERVGLIAALMTALFPPLPYFGALVLTELWTAFVATAAMLMCLRAAQQQQRRDFIFAGVLLSATTLVRPAFFLLPFFLATAVPILVRQQRSRRALTGWGVLAAAAVVTMLPWFGYNYVYLGQFTLSPAGGIGRGLWEGSWQGRWAGRLQSELTELATGIADRDELDRRVRERAAQANEPAGPMLQYVHEWRDIRAIWDTPTDPFERIRARVAADGEYLRVAMLHIREDPIGHVRRRLTRGLFSLWAAEVPIRYSLINSLPTWLVYGIWLVQVALLALAAWGAVWLARHQRWLEAVMLTLPLIYVTGVHLPLLCEARQSLPVKPLVIVLAATCISNWSRRPASGR
jgi:4-amino-4-deoxy-L-arabinose transferase-like glycosyltransferase